MKRLIASIFFVSLTACGGGGTSGSGNGTTVDEITDPVNYTDVGARGVSETATVSYVALDGDTPISGTSMLAYFDGALSGDNLDGEDLDSASFENNPNGEFSRIVRVSGAESLFGVVGLKTDTNLPPDGTTDYNAGWVGIFATTDDDVPYSLTGTVTLTANWDTDRLSANFANLSGTRNVDEGVSNVGSITLSDAVITGADFAGGSVSGNGIFSGLNGSSQTTGTQGIFFGPEADEVGGVLIIVDDDIDVLGAFQAD